MGIKLKKEAVFYFACFCWMGFFLSQCTCTGPATYHYPEIRKDASGNSYHILKKGETLWRVAQTYGVPLENIIRYNNIDDVTTVPAGKRIYMPAQNELLHEDAPDFIWPLEGIIARGFKRSGPIQYSGIDILSPEGTPIIAAAAGSVIYNGDHMAGYGNMIIIKHTNGFSSVYANNQVNMVKIGDNVAQGDVIAKVGNTGNYSEPHLHFEIRKEKKSVNPRLYLPNI